MTPALTSPMHPEPSLNTCRGGACPTRAFSPSRCRGGASAPPPFPSRCRGGACPARAFSPSRCRGGASAPPLFPRRCSAGTSVRHPFPLRFPRRCRGGSLDPLFPSTPRATPTNAPNSVKIRPHEKRARKPFRIKSFADPHPLTLIESHLYKKHGGGGSPQWDRLSVCLWLLCPPTIHPF